MTAPAPRPGWRGQLLVLLPLALIYWWAVAAASHVSEPWDAPRYWTIAYPGALLLAFGAGLGLRAWPWLTGYIVMLAQWPVMVALAGLGPLAPVGLMYLCVLALPAVLAAWAGVRLRR